MGEKAQSNIAKHGISFEEARRFRFETALIAVDDRRDYGELRLVALGFIASACISWLSRGAAAPFALFLLRKANSREIRYYEQNV